MRTIVVTGGAGFIGSNFVRLAMARSDARVVVADKLTYAGNLESLRDVSSDPRFVFARGDIADRSFAESLYAQYRPTWVVNFAAESHVDRSIDGPRAFIEANIVGAFEMLEAARRYLLASPSPDFRFLHVSTDEVYGSLGPTGAFSETTPYAPNSPYAASKAAADHLVRAYCETYRLPVLLTNCSNNYGPYQYPEKLIPLMILNAVDARPLPIYGDGGNIRDWLYVEDHCDGILTVLERGQVGGKYNIGGNNEHTNLQIVDLLCSTLEKLLPAADNAALRQRGLGAYAQLKTFVTDRPGHDRRYAIDASHIQRELGWRPRYDFASGLHATVRWYLDHRDWCEAVQRGEDARRRLGLSLAAAK
jgi:dTDP-glucose 4,6-dehydratase